MISFKKLLLLILCITLLIGSINNFVEANNKIKLSREVNENEIVINTNHSVLHIEKNYLNKNEQINIAEKVEQGIVDVINYFGNEYLEFNFEKNKIDVYIQSDKKQNAISSSGIIYLENVKEGFSPYISSIVYVVANEHWQEKENWLIRGLATYLNKRFGKYPPHPVVDKGIDELAKESINKKEYDLVYKYFPEMYYNNTSEKTAFNRMAGSFIKYIENEYGKKNLLEIYNGSNIEETTNKSIEQLKKEWKQSLKKS